MTGWDRWFMGTFYCAHREGLPPAKFDASDMSEIPWPRLSCKRWAVKWLLWIPFISVCFFFFFFFLLRGSETGNHDS